MTTPRWLALLLLAGILIRTGLWVTYEPIQYPDTPTYMSVAQNILTGDFSDYEGRRTPGFPLVLAFARLDPRTAWAVQMIAGLGISALLFSVGLTLTGHAGFAALLGMTYNLNLPQLFFEANLVSETTSTLAIVAVCALALAAYRRLSGRRPSGSGLVGLGLVAGFAALTRPQFVFLPLLLGIGVGWGSLTLETRGLRRALGRACAVTLPALVLILGWCAFNYARVGIFTISTQAGIALFDHSLAFLELAPDRYATIREIGLKHRDAKVARTGLHSASWDAVPELLAVTGLSLPALSKELERMSVEMFLRHPIRYATGVGHAWFDFWAAPFYWRPHRIASTAVASALAGCWRIEQLLLRLANAAFMLIAVAAAVSARLRQRVDWSLSLTTIAAIVVLTSIVQALAIWVENARYAIPVQPLVIVVVLVAATRYVASLTLTSPQPTPAPAGRGIDLRDRREELP